MPGWAPCAAAGTRPPPHHLGTALSSAVPWDRSASAGSLPRSGRALPGAYGAAGPLAHSSHARAGARGEMWERFLGRGQGKKGAPGSAALGNWSTRVLGNTARAAPPGPCPGAGAAACYMMAGKKTPGSVGGLPGNPNHPSLPRLGTLPHRCPALGAHPDACLPCLHPEMRQGGGQSSFPPFHFVSLLGFGWSGSALISAAPTPAGLQGSCVLFFFFNPISLRRVTVPVPSIPAPPARGEGRVPLLPGPHSSGHF